MTVVPFKPKLYEAQMFRAVTEAGEFAASGTLCGHIDFTGPFKRTLCLSPDEVLAIIVMLQQAREDVLAHSDPHGDPRIVG